LNVLLAKPWHCVTALALVSLAVACGRKLIIGEGVKPEGATLATPT
jgi:hypothetical protein